MLFLPYLAGKLRAAGYPPMDAGRTLDRDSDRNCKIKYIITKYMKVDILFDILDNT